ncbi:MAG: ATP-binding protein [Candidatus Aureabacteria bacterium]|nr:ATP-binding protein [Candidatus Auribacterota bacterium]
MIAQRMPRDVITTVTSSNPRFLRALRSLVDEVTYEMGFSAKARGEVIQAIDEACTNIIKHSYEGNFNKKIILTLKDLGDRLEVIIKDFGKKAHPGRIRHRELHDVKPGGLGVYIIKRSMDVVWYDISPRLGTELKMVKYLKKPRKYY